MEQFKSKAQQKQLFITSDSTAPMPEWIPHNNPTYKFKILDYTYTSEPSINSALPLKSSTIKFVLYMIGVVLSMGFLWLLVKWSSKRRAVLLFNVCSLEEATHFLIEEEDVVGGSKIIQRIDKFDIRSRARCVSFNYHERTYLFFEEKQAFLPIRYQELGIHLDQLHRNVFEPYSKSLRPQLCEYYGPNIITLSVQSRLQVFIQEMLTPYEVFQTYAILLWIYQQYYIFSFILLAYALYTYWQTSSEVVDNQLKLAKESYFQIHCKIIVNQNENVGAINFNDEAQIQRISVTGADKMGIASSQASHKDQMIEEDSEPQAELVTRIVRKNSVHMSPQTIDNSARTKNLLDRKKVKPIEVSSRELLPGDILILHEGDIVPCDCIILKGEILVDESYVTGEKYLTRKFELQNFTYKKQSENNFTIYLGTKIAKIKNFTQIKANSFNSNSLQESIARNEFSMPNEIVCLVINTNYNTLRGKYLRAIRYQAKHQESFTKETIYFIYMLMFMTTVVFCSMLSIFRQGQSAFEMVITYLDLIFTSIPPTLPTLLSVGINFAMHRLKNYDVACVMPSNILTGGKVDTIVLEGSHALGKQYEVESMTIGIKQNAGFGETYSTVEKFYAHHTQPMLESSSSSLQESNKKKLQKSKQYEFGETFINAVSICHGLEYFEDKIEGKPIEKKIFEFSACEIESQNVYLSKNARMTLDKKIYFKQKQKTMAVIATVQKHVANGSLKSVGIIQNKLEQFSLLDEDDEGLATEGKKESKPEPKSEQIRINLIKKVMFVKGPAQKILRHCIEATCPKSSHDFIVDMAEKGFSLICYAYMEVDEDIKSSSYYMKLIAEGKLVFLGFLVLKQIRYLDNIEALKAFNKADIDVLLVSEERELETSSVAILNQLCDKKELLLCSLNKNKNKINCKGHVEWESTDEHNPLHEFVMELQDFGKDSKLSLNSPLYEDLFMKRDYELHEFIFKKSIIFNEMQYRHERNLYSQLQKRQKVSFAVGGGGIVSECANLSMELQRDQSSLLSSFHTKSRSLMTIFHCLRICRAGLATNFHVFSMMILFSLIQFTTVCLLYTAYQYVSDTQMLYEDLFVTFPIFVTLNLTKPSSRLSKQKPMTSFFDAKALISMLGQVLLQFFAQLGFLLYLLSFKEFQEEKNSAHKYFIETGNFMSKSVTVISLFVLSNYLYLGVVLSTSVSKPFRKPFYTNPWYTLILVLLWVYNTLIVIVPSMAPEEIRKTGLSQNEESIIVISMILGNLMMVLMYLYENLLSWAWKKMKMRRLGRRQVEGERTNPAIEMMEKA